MDLICVSVRHGTQGFTHSRQALYPLNYILALDYFFEAESHYEEAWNTMLLWLS